MADIAQWRKTLLTLPDSSFFELMRNYLGEIQTPFNKQSLLDRLQTFFKREATQRAIVAAIDETDARFLSAVDILEGPTRGELLSFLSAEYTRLEVENRLLNLQDRLLVFPDAETDRLCLNPVLEPVLRAHIVRRHALFPREELAEPTDAEPWITDTLLTAVFSLLLSQPLAFRADGRLKRRSATRVESVAPLLLEGGGERLSILRWTLTSLGLARDEGGDLQPDVDAWRELAGLSAEGRLSTVWAVAALVPAEPDDEREDTGAAGRPRHSEAPSELGCALQALLGELQPGCAMRGSHILQLLGIAAARCSREAGHAAPGGRPAGGAPGAGATAGWGHGPAPDEELLDGLCRIGVLAEAGDNRYTSAPEAARVAAGAGDPGEGAAENTEQPQPAGVITPSYQMTLTPQADLRRSLAAAAAADLVRYDRYCEYEIHRGGVMRAFRAGFRAEEIRRSLEDLHGGPLPQNVRFSIDTWKDEYERVELLDGIVLLVDESHAALAEHSPALRPYIRRTLGPGAFLLAREEEEEWRAALEHAGLGAVPAVKVVGTARTPDLRGPRFREPGVVRLPAGAPAGKPGDTSRGRPETASPPPGGSTRMPEPAPGGNAAAGANAAAGGASVPDGHGELSEAADKAGLSEEQRREVERRIERKLILVPEQVTTALAPREVQEARGLDYVGKVRLIEQAISRGTDHLEITERGQGGNPRRHFLRPLRLDKRSQNLVLHGEPVGEQREVAVRVDKIGLVRVVRGTLFAR